VKTVEPPVSRAEIKEPPPTRYSSPPPDIERQSPPQEPPFISESFDKTADLPLMKAQARSSSVESARSDADRIKSALEARGKRLLLSKLDNASSIEVVGDTLRIAFPEGGVVFKRAIESKESSKALEEICREVLGRALRVSVSVGAENPIEQAPAQSAAPQQKAEEHPVVRAVAEKFHGQVEIIKPER
jgi:hypothetical protein